MPQWEVKFGTEVKREKGINRGARIGAVIQKGNIKYAVYQLMSNQPKAVTVGRLWKELNDLRDKGLERAIVFCTQSGEKALFEKVASENLSNLWLQELSLLSFPNGIYSINTLHSDGFSRLIRSKFPGLIPAPRRYADFQWQSSYVSVLVTNDAIKRRLLLSHIGTKAYELEQKSIIIVCTETQFPVFSKDFPSAYYAVLSGDMELFLPKYPHSAV